MLTILIGALAAVVGFLVFAFIGAVLASFAAAPLHISAMEGARGYFAIAIGLFVGILGAAATIFFTLRRLGLRSIKILIGGVAAVASVFLFAAAAVGAWYSMQPHVSNPNGPEPILWMELRAPANLAGSLSDLTAELNTERNAADVILQPVKQDQSLTRTGYVPLYYRTSRRLIVVRVPNSATRLYNLHLTANAMSKKYREWSPWQKPDFIDQPNGSGPKGADSGPDLEIRYRVETAE
jgi:hypothetical protein